MIPRAAAEAAAKSYYDGWVAISGSINRPWAEIPQSWRDEHIAAMVKAMQAGIDAWPGMRILSLAEDDDSVHLPLTKEEPHE